MIKLIATDLDNTMLDANGLVTDETRKLLAAAEARGVKLALSSGRSINSVKGVGASIGLPYYAICYNGGLIIAPGCDGEDQVIYENHLDEETFRTIVEYAHEEDLYVQGYDRGVIMVENLRTDIHPDPDLRYAEYREVGDLLGVEYFKTPKLLVSCDPAEVPRHMEELNKRLGFRIYMAQSERYIIEIMPAGVNKGYALSMLARHLKVRRSQIAAFGDNTNDLPLLRAAGTAVAVANAVDAVKEEADMITEGTRDQGFNEAVKKLIPGLE
jgi:Cof subfamily protein (haloacid dehalogenase superfamily)